jgi:enolase
MSEIVDVRAREVLDSRGNPTVEVDVLTADGAIGRAAVPSGASTGSREALELRDGDKSRYGGKGVLTACANVNGELRDAVLGMEVTEQEGVDRKMIDLDGTENKARLGANAILGVSMAAAHAAAQEKSLPLYQVPGRRCLSAAGADDEHHQRRRARGQQRRLPGVHDPARRAPSIREAVRYGAEVFHALKSVLNGAGSPPASATRAASRRICRPTRPPSRSSWRPSTRPATRPGRTSTSAWTWPRRSSTRTASTTSRARAASSTPPGMTDLLLDWCGKYPIISIEDGLAEGDWDGWKDHTERLGGQGAAGRRRPVRHQHQDPRRGHREGHCQLDPHQGQPDRLPDRDPGGHPDGQGAGYSAVVSHRSGETEDTTIADLVSPPATGQIKTGSLSRSDRVAKYNQLMRIEDQLGDAAVYAGRGAFKHL